MTTYYHVAPAAYQDGDDLLCFAALEARGDAPTWRWECEPADTDVVCLFTAAQRDEAAEFLELFQPDGRLLRVAIPDADDGSAAYEALRFTRVPEGYMAVRWCIPACYVEVCE